jgi:hypothetical protein
MTITLHQGDRRQYYCKNCRGTPKSVYEAEGRPDNEFYCSGCWKGPVEKAMRYYLKCKCGAEGVGYGYSVYNKPVIEEPIEWEGGINDDFDPEIDNKDHLCKHEEYEIEDSESDRDSEMCDYDNNFQNDSNYGIDRTY